MLRSLSNDFIQALLATKFWANIRQDNDLFPEIRRDAVTVYYRGAALIRDLRLRDGVLSGTTHQKYIPIYPPPKPVVQLALHEEDFHFAERVEGWPLRDARPQILQAYKSRIKCVGGPEDAVIHALCCCTGNTIVDQEIKFQLSGDKTADKIDILSFDSATSTFCFVEVKQIADVRLREGPDGLHEVASQLKLYSDRLRAQANSIRSGIENIIRLKARLGLGHRITACHGVPVERLLAKPVLVIGGCSKQEVRDILQLRAPWASLMNSLQGVAAGLIVCGSDGTRLDLSDGRSRRWFDRELVT
ncbi:hypothetical protein [Lacipirellula sp.]|uniref:hypothetical protein n=1 Tax=Lacipirellula sp. TaxID=2691419 RepID=UPI003D0D4CBD